MNRWDDQHRSLSEKLVTLKDIDDIERSPIIKEVMSLVQQHDPSLLDSENAFDFPLDLKRRRWYDDDPYLWTMFNTLKTADKTLLEIVEIYLGNTLRL